MTDRSLRQRSDGELEAALRGLAPTLDWPTGARPGQPDLATAVRARIESLPAPHMDRWAGLLPVGWWRRSGRPARRALVLALVALLAVAAIAGAVGLGLPGLRLILGDMPASPTPSPASPIAEPGSPTPEVLGGSMRLGESLDPTNQALLDDRAGFRVRLPADPAVGPPDAAWIDDLKGGQVTLVWASGRDLPPTIEGSVGLLLSQFRGDVEVGFLTKLVGQGTTIEPVEVEGNDGYWLQGDPHVFFWEGPDGFVDDPRRWVGDVLLWSDGPITYRLETALGRDEAIEIAQSLR